MNLHFITLQSFMVHVWMGFCIGIGLLLSQKVKNWVPALR